MFLLLASVFIVPSAEANGDYLYLECPCEVESDGTSARVTAGVRSFRSVHTGQLYIGLQADYRGTAVLVGWTRAALELAPDSALTKATYEIELNLNRSLHERLQERIPRDWPMEIALFERVGGGGSPLRDRVRLESQANPVAAFQSSDLDLAKDSDGDGAGDYDERAQGTDPADPQSVAPESTHDVLVFHSPGVADAYDGDPTTRIQHSFTLANQIMADSGVQAQFRIVGMQEVELDETQERARPESSLRILQATRHAADLVIVLRPARPDLLLCGYADRVGGYRTRGHFELGSEESNFAGVFANCGAEVLAHELGHLMGLGHSYWQDEVGTWRWSRGHGVDHDFRTIMSYALPSGYTRSLPVFSDPRNDCVGLLAQAKPCGVDGEEVNGADAAATLNAARFRIESLRDAYPDTDGDGFVDPVDALPNDSSDWIDTDGDGVGDNADTDDDGDGVADGLDAFPLDGAESADTDGDGVGDNADAFPSDDSETSDADGDGVGDNSDVFPEDPAESVDADGDGVGDNSDAFPDDPNESADTDGDGIGDKADSDADDDGFGDAFDVYPLDPARSNLASYLFVGERPGDQIGEMLSPGGEGEQASFILGVPQYDYEGKTTSGAAYLVAASDLEALDIADGKKDRVINVAHVPSGANSWRFVGNSAYDFAGYAVSSNGDMDGDGQTDLLVGAPHYFTGEIRPGGDYFKPGGAFFVSGADITSADAADGTADHTINLENVASQPRSWAFIGENKGDALGQGLAFVPDIDGDGSTEILLGAPGYDRSSERTGTGAAYLLSSGDFDSADAADGVSDGVIGLGNASSQSRSWKFIGEWPFDGSGSPVSVPGDLTGDGTVSIAINAGFRSSGPQSIGIYLISLSSLAAADEADGHTDHVVDLRNVAAQPDSWKLVDGGIRRWNSTPAYSVATGDDSRRALVVSSAIVSYEDLLPADGLNGVVDGVVSISGITAQTGSWRVENTHLTVVGDTDGDGSEEFMGRVDAGTGSIAHLISAGSFVGAKPDRVSNNGVISLDVLRKIVPVRSMHGPWLNGHINASTAGDVDGDGLGDTLVGDRGPSVEPGPGAVYLLLSTDLEGLDRVDGAVDSRLSLANLAGDTDGDGTHNALDLDDDGDGVPDSVDEFPLDSDEWADTDRDGFGDNADAYPENELEHLDTDGDGLGDFYADNDDDGDGIPDSEDLFPLDTDDDGVANDEDPDDDNDGIPDDEDRFALDGTESADTDGDGIGNNADNDDDGDGIVDDEDVFPLHSGESADSDGDGVGDNGDVFPEDATESVDYDGDGIGDNADTDDDNDGVADADDDYPLNPAFSRDTDGDGVPDSRDRYPTNPREWENTDGAGFGDNRDTDDDNDGVPDTEDRFPKDRTRSDLASVRLSLGAVNDAFVPGVGSAGDLDGDGKAEILFRAPDREGDTAVFVASYDDLGSADETDGTLDGSVAVENLPWQSGAWKLLGVEDRGIEGAMFALGDLDDDGRAEFLVSDGQATSTGYIVSGADLLGADALDGAADGAVHLSRIPSQPSSWEMRGLPLGTALVAAPPGDFDGDRVADLAIGQAGRGASGVSPGTVRLYSINGLSALDALDGTVDGVTSLESGHERWRLEGASPGDAAGTDLAMADFDGDGLADILIGAPGYDREFPFQGAAYLMSGRDRGAADLADGAEDSRIVLSHIAALPNSWRFVGENAYSDLGVSVVAGDLHGDEQIDLVLSSRDYWRRPILSVISGNSGDLAAFDLIDGVNDGVIRVSSISSGTGTRLRVADVPTGISLGLADFDGDGRDGLVVGLDRYHVGSKVALLLAVSPDGGGTYEIYAPQAASAELSVAAGVAGDVDDDGQDDILLAVVHREASKQAADPNTAAVYVLLAAELPLLDAEDGTTDGRIFLSNVVRERR